MFRKSQAIFLSMAFVNAFAAVPDATVSRTRLSAAAIVDKNVAARGGLPMWRAVHTMSLAGKMGVGGNQRATLPIPPPDATPGRKMSPLPVPPRPVEEVQLSFLMELQRPRKMRFELEFNGQTALQVYDGSSGWKLRPYLNRRVV